MKALLIGALFSFLKNLAIAMFGENTIKWAFFKVAKWFTRKTPTKLDDEFVEQLEENYPRN